jgi:hypothetical protein
LRYVGMRARAANTLTLQAETVSSPRQSNQGRIPAKRTYTGDRLSGIAS